MALPEITQENVHVFIPLKVAKVVEMQCEVTGEDKRSALINFYNSKVYEILEKEETKLWYEAPRYLYDGWVQEQQGKELDI